MNGGNVATEYARQELTTEDAVLREGAMVTNAVLRRALAIAACEYVLLASEHGCPGLDADPDAGIGLMVCWVTRAAEEKERERAAAEHGR